jgi:hypothetical protein
VESRTYPGEFVYENIVSGDRQAWRPDEEPPGALTTIALLLFLFCSFEM